MLNTREYSLFFVITILLLLFFNFSNHFVNARKETYFILNWGHKGHSVSPNGEQYFIQRNCTYRNCYLTNNNTYFKDMKMFDAIVFDVRDLQNVRKINYLPLGRYRSTTQKYIFTALEPEDYFPLYEPFYNNFFNWTWTYRLDSTIRRTYISVFNKENQIIGPKANLKWETHKDPIDQNLIEKLQFKTRLAAWFVSRCWSKGKREEFVSELGKELKRLENETIDVFGKCGWYSCGTRKDKKCSRMLKRNYMFYLAFENSLSPDYVTEKLTTALDNYNIPIVYGGANYSWFLPPGSYLNARELGPEVLARKMLNISNNITAASEFFRWRNHYKIESTLETVAICDLCEIMNHDKMMNRTSIKRNFVQWWNHGSHESKEKGKY